MDSQALSPIFPLMTRMRRGVILNGYDGLSKLRSEFSRVGNIEISLEILILFDVPTILLFSLRNNE
jgi:hypothetical protein